MLERMGKGATSRDALAGIAIAHAAGLRVHANLIVGFPGETRDSFERTLELAVPARPDTVLLSPLVAQENSWLYADRLGERFGLKGQGKSWRHASMDSETAYALVDEGYRRLTEAGVHLGSEYAESALIAYGYSVEEAVQLTHDVELLCRPRPWQWPGFEDAVRRLRAAVLERFPARLARDQRAWAC